jgi:Tol biopolymer transport system component
VIATTQAISVHTMNVADGAMKPVLSTPGTSRAAFFSPDGKRLAMLTSTSGHFDLTVVNTDGSGQRTFTLPFEPVAPLMRWSPDSRRLALSVNGRTGLAVVDANTGETKLMNDDGVGGVTWARDSRSIRFWRGRPSGPRTTSRTIYEVSTEGTLRTLRDFPATMRDRGFFITDELLEYATADAEYVFSAETGQSRRLPVAGRALSGMPSSDGRWLAFLLAAGPGRRGQIQIMTTGGDSSRVLDLPFETYRGAPVPSIVFAPDNRRVFMVGRKLGQQALILFEVPVNGGPPREIAQLPGEVPYDHMDVSPDGRTITYPVQQPPTTTIYELDLSSLKRPAGRQE